MRVEFRKSFVRDLERVRDKDLRVRVQESIAVVEQARDLQEIPNLRKIRAADRSYRIRLGDYRVGLMLLEDDTVVFVRFLNRKDLYRYFP